MKTENGSVVFSGSGVLSAVKIKVTATRVVYITSEFLLAVKMQPGTNMTLGEHLVLWELPWCFYFNYPASLLQM